MPTLGAPTLPEMPVASLGEMRAVVPPNPRTAVTLAEIPRAKRRSRSTASIPAVVPSASLAQLERTPDPTVARYSLVPGRSQGQPRLATLAEYLKALPAGLASYPETKVKGILVRTLVTDLAEVLPVKPGLPPELERWLRAPPAAVDWAPFVAFAAMHLVMYDVRFAPEGEGAAAETAYESWAFERSVSLFKLPHLRKLVAVDAPESLFAGHVARWASLCRGSTLDVLTVARGSAALRIHYPAHAWPKICRLGLGAGMRAALTLAGATSIQVTSVSESARAARFELRWTQRKL
jgi:hypothetical protein